MLKVSDINVYYGNIHAIKDISFEVAKGEIVSLIGANGAGKSTILKTVSGLLRTKTGSITFLDGDIRTAAPNHIVKLGLAHVPEGRREQQMLAMGRALMSHPTLLMLDEPSMGLAPILVEQIFDIIQELHRAGTTILLVEQNAQMALSIADRAYVLETGRIVMSGTAKEMREDERIQKAYLGM